MIDCPFKRNRQKCNILIFCQWCIYKYFFIFCQCIYIVYNVSLLCSLFSTGPCFKHEEGWKKLSKKCLLALKIEIYPSISVHIFLMKDYKVVFLLCLSISSIRQWDRITENQLPNSLGCRADKSDHEKDIKYSTAEILEYVCAALFFSLLSW